MPEFLSSSLKKMKTAEDYLASLRARNPALLRAAKIQMTPEEFLKQIELAYRRGQAAVFEAQDAITGDMPEFMKGMFRGK